MKQVAVNFSTLALIALLSVFLQQCQKQEITPITDTPSDGLVHFQSSIQTIVATKCIACHDSNATVPMDDYNAIYNLALSGQLKGSLTNNPDYLQMAQLSNLDSTNLHLFLTWIDQDCQH